MLVLASALLYKETHKNNMQLNTDLLKLQQHMKLLTQAETKAGNKVLNIQLTFVCQSQIKIEEVEEDSEYIIQK